VISATAFQTVYSRLHAVTPSGKVTGLRGSELLSTEAVTGGVVKPLSTSTPTTVNVAADLVFKVTFKNAGNFQEVNVPVKLTVTGVGKSVTKRKTVLSVLKGDTKTVSFGNLNLPTSAFGAASASVDVEIGKVPGEQNLSNNRASYKVFFSLPSGG
jgi:hypothetical protein